MPPPGTQRPSTRPLPAASGRPTWPNAVGEKCTRVFSKHLQGVCRFFQNTSSEPKYGDNIQLLMTAEHTLSMLMFSLLSTLVSFFAVQHWSGGCSSKHWRSSHLRPPSIDHLPHEHHRGHLRQQHHPAQNFRFLHVLSVLCAARVSEPKHLVLTCWQRGLPCSSDMTDRICSEVSSSGVRTPHTPS